MDLLDLGHLERRKYNMLGSIIGDTCGKPYEFDNVRRKDVDLYRHDAFPTDDSVLTCAIAEALLELYPFDYSIEGQARIKEAVVSHMRKWAARYPNGGYGNRFMGWLYGNTGYKPYRSFGNGAGMRVSSVSYFASSEEEVKLLSRLVTEVTHNHPEGLKGAEAVAMLTYLALQGESKENLYTRALSYYPEIASFEYESLKRDNYFDETCQGSIPQALYCLFISKDFEDAIRTAISIGGDSDTIACMVGAIAEPLWGIPEEMKQKILPHIPMEMQEIAKKVKAIHYK